MSEEEARIKAELEKEIEEGLQEEILDKLLLLTCKLERLHARQKARNEEYLKNKNDFTTPINSLVLDNDPKPQSPALFGRFSPSSSPVHAKAAAGTEDKKRKNPSNFFVDRIDSSGSLHKEFDWVRSLRSASRSLRRPNPLRKIANQERVTTDYFSSSSSSTNKSGSLAGSTESNNGKRGSINTPPRCHLNGDKPCKGNYNNIGLVSKEDKAILECVGGNGKSNSKVCSSSCPRQNMSCSAMQKGDILEGNSTQQRKFFTDMINKLKDSTINSVENPTKLKKEYGDS